MTKSKSSLYLSQAEKYWRNNDLKAARLAFADARDECSRNGDLQGLAEAWMRSGDLEMFSGRQDDAKTAYVSALSGLSPDCEAQGISAEIRLKLARIAIENENACETEALLDQAEALFDEADNRSGLARTAEMRGMLMMRQGDYETALPFYRKACLMLERESDTHREAVVLRTISRLYMLLNRTDLAHDALEKSASLFRENGDLIGEAGALTAIGVLRTTIGDYVLANRAFRKAVMLYGKAGHTVGEGEASFYLARSEIASGEKESRRDALKNYKKSVAFLDGAALPDLVEKAKREIELLEKTPL